MSIRVALHHVTHYSYDRPVQLSPHVVRLRPAPHCRTPIVSYSLRILPGENFLNWQQDPFGNYQARLVFPKPSRELKVEVDLVAEMASINPFEFFVEEAAENYPLTYEPTLKQELVPYLYMSNGGSNGAGKAGGGPLFEAMVTEARGMAGVRRNLDVLVDLNRLVERSLRYDIRMEPGVFAPEETLSRGHGSCRDFAWLLVNLMRRLGYAARFVSGYSIQLKADQKPLEGPAGVSEDVTDLHAWAEAFLPGAGWVGFDPTSGLACGEGHIPLACTAEPGSAAAITGSFSWNKSDEDEVIDEHFAFHMKVRRLDDPPRPTKPYDERAWEAILAAGDVVDEVLTRHDVRLTMGGEPTFVSIDDRDGEEWNTAALGPRKAELADELLKRLRGRFAPGALLHHGQGKWYPGEPLPRWAYSCYFRKDGQPVWRDVALIADAPAARPAANPAERTAEGARVALAFGEVLCRRLGVEARRLIPGFEDVFYYLWRERKLPVNVDPFESRLENEMDRARLRAVFEQGLRSVVGYALPLQAVSEGGHDIRWRSGAWHLRDERLYLLPGDSPMGYRLPLEALPWSKPEDVQQTFEQDPLAARPPLPATVLTQRPHRTSTSTSTSTTPPRAAPGNGRPPAPEAAPARGQSAPDVIRTALCLESRGGVLFVFMPPVPTLEEYLDLVTAVEETAAELGQKLRLEGYPPPSDHRMQRLQLTPDPGVLEVNIHPASSWRELVENTTVLYEEARQTRLATEKFMLDGRHTGTGGGNHVVLGGATPADSPILRRPDLLRSLSAYWVNHPSLSYLFSGLFIGPTSQAPRIDEARHDSLYELEIAGSQLTGGSEHRPWIVDRLYRHLLVDVTGNTHRAEMCIDKLYSPDSASGRQGLLELRAFEMPPHARMSAAQQLLVRALVAWFWREPYTRLPVRWGTSLVDRFMLPHFVSEDFADVVGDLRRAGFPMDRAWFAPHFEFRFPVYGRALLGGRGIEIELRQALEPWHVLGEEAAGGGNVRFVDSSVERVQVRLRGTTDDRHVLTCNGRRVPLAGTGRKEEAVAGVRFRAWQPPSGLHPTIAAHAPLVFDLCDTWAGRSLGGCTYHVSHPGGRAHDTFPVTALEAESRRLARFQALGHSPGPMPEIPEEDNPELPHTLDLRRAPGGRAALFRTADGRGDGHGDGPLPPRTIFAVPAAAAVPATVAAVPAPPIPSAPLGPSAASPSPRPRGQS
jgi:uncharacterized protein (DUF2126 family)/transglutaminase-like putative cysteine protease